MRGAGLIWGLELSRDAAPVVPAGLAHGVVVNRTAETVVRLLPPLVITEAEADEALNRLDAALGAMRRMTPTSRTADHTLVVAGGVTTPQGFRAAGIAARDQAAAP